ncbi:MAG: GNAT family N-acetyltransferase [Actinobacteria bacterium]|nr:GNAT family N-acetyltransferase [Actinomycetota bacterium]MBU1866441.1 GNAT family N-acetyltransferase [Actinomycetota bacterium]
MARGRDWEARFADGMHRRINSATVWAADDPDGTVAELEAWYERRGIDPIFKLTDASAPGLDELLAGRGYLPDARVAVMTADLPAGRRSAPAADVTLSDAPSEEWAGSFGDMAGYGPRQRRLLDATLGRIDRRAVYASLRREGSIVSVGMSVAEDRHAGVFEMITHPDHRGRGHAGSILDALLGWMSGPGGATVAYLQVLEGNQPAERLYRGAGFTPRYRYWYRVRSAGLSTTPH